MVLLKTTIQNQKVYEKVDYFSVLCLLTINFVVNIMNTKYDKGDLSVMVDDSEIADLSEVYSEMNADGKEKMVLMAKHLLSVQLIGKGQEKSSLDINEKFENKDN